MSPGLELVCVFLLSLGTARAQIPIQCGTRAHVERGECCPVFWGDGSRCGSASGRGNCQDVTGETPQEREERARQQANTRDFRIQWPTYFFGRLCVCQGNFGGADCGECAYGWRGERCQEKYIVIRQDISNMTVYEQNQFLQRLHQSKSSFSQRYVIYTSQSSVPYSPLTFRRASVYNIASYLHHIASKDFSQMNFNFGHRGTAFLGWHRLFLIHLEHEIRNITGDDSFSLPYWSWPGKTRCDVCTNQLFGSSLPDGRLSSQSMFSSWRNFCDEEGSQSTGFDLVCPPVPGGPVIRYNQYDQRFTELPTWADVYSCLQIQMFDTHPYDVSAIYSFRNALEGNINPQALSQKTTSMHNLVHRYCSGTLEFSNKAANDPLFASLHATVDKILEMWLRQHPRATYPAGQLPYGHRAGDKLVPFIPLYENWEMLKSCREFGYDYDDME